MLLIPVWGSDTEGIAFMRNMRHNLVRASSNSQKLQLMAISHPDSRYHITLRERPLQSISTVASYLSWLLTSPLLSPTLSTALKALRKVFLDYRSHNHQPFRPQRRTWRACSRSSRDGSTRLRRSTVADSLQVQVKEPSASEMLQSPSNRAQSKLDGATPRPFYDRAM